PSGSLCYLDGRHRSLHPFPTRRSSDLTQAGARDTPTVDTGALAPLGIGPVEETVYRTLLRSPGSTASKLAETLALSPVRLRRAVDRKSTRLNSSHVKISYAVFCLKKKK